MSQLEGKIAVVTGANSGLGLAIAKTFVEKGAAKVYVTGRRKVELDKAVASLGTHAVAVPSDVTNPTDLDRLYDRVKTEAGHVDVIVANAGFAEPAPLGSLTEDHVERLLNTNVKGLIWTVQKALPLIRPGGSIILTASVVAGKGFANWSIYSATKAAVRSFARTWASDLKGRNIRVNVVSPGPIKTPGYDVAGLPQDQVQGFLEFSASITPLARIGRDDEAAKVVAFLASDESSFVSASEYFVDGGMAQV
jgi:NAD(P)-dependent dehydrogenase (short-subunit alcohol dehydrogenase family)